MEAQSTRRVRATIHYDGTDFHGSQLQPDVRTVQGEIEARLSRLFDREARIDAAGRTDSGVHAVAQEIAFDAPARWEPGELHRALNALLPPDLWAEWMGAAAPGFHPRFDARGRRYEYVLGVEPSGRTPLLRRRIWALDGRPDPERLHEMASGLVGEHDFVALARAGQEERGTRCRVAVAEWRGLEGPFPVFRIEADRFLHRMVRYLVATQVEVATGRRERGELEGLLEGDAETRPPSPAPPQGLYLSGVRYAEGWNRAAESPGVLPRAGGPARGPEDRAPGREISR